MPEVIAAWDCIIPVCTFMLTCIIPAVMLATTSTIPALTAIPTWEIPADIVAVPANAATSPVTAVPVADMDTAMVMNV